MVVDRIQVRYNEYPNSINKAYLVKYISDIIGDGVPAGKNATDFLKEGR